MFRNSKALLAACLFLIALTGCESINPVGSAYQRTKISMHGVTHYSLAMSKQSEMPDCIAVLPFTAPDDVSKDVLTEFRKSVAGKISTLTFKDVEIEAIDRRLSSVDENNLKHIGRDLECDGLLLGEILQSTRVYFGVFSHLSMTAKLRLIDSRNGSTVWESEHTSGRNGGGLPISVTSAISGAISALINASDETQLSVIDDLSRNLIATLPEPITPLRYALASSGQSNVYNRVGPARGFGGVTPTAFNGQQKPILAGYSSASASQPTNFMLSKPQVIALIKEETQQIGGVPQSLALAVARVESNFDASAESNKGARGVMQIMPRTASDALNVNPDHLWNPRVNVKTGLRFLKRLYHRYGNRWDLALSHYNGGSLKKINGRYVPHGYTRKYVASVKKWQLHYLQKTGGDSSYRKAAHQPDVIKVSAERPSRTNSEIHVDRRHSPSVQITSAYTAQPSTESTGQLVASLEAMAQINGVISQYRAW